MSALSLHAAHWLAEHKGPKTPAVRAVREALEIRFREQPPDYAVRLVEALGHIVVVDPSAPAECGCGCRSVK